VTVRHRATASARVGQGQGHQQGAEDPDRGVPVTEQHEIGQDGQGRAEQHARRTSSGATEIGGPQPARRSGGTRSRRTARSGWTGCPVRSSRGSMCGRSRQGGAAPATRPKSARHSTSSCAIRPPRVASTSRRRRGGWRPRRHPVGRTDGRAGAKEDVVEADYEIVDEGTKVRRERRSGSPPLLPETSNPHQSILRKLTKDPRCRPAR